MNRSHHPPIIDARAFASCPIPRSRYDHIVLGHGGGGLLTAELIHRVFLPAFDNDILSALEDHPMVRLAQLHA